MDPRLHTVLQTTYVAGPYRPLQQGEDAAIEHIKAEGTRVQNKHFGSVLATGGLYRRWYDVMGDPHGASTAQEADILTIESDNGEIHPALGIRAQPGRFITIDG